MKFLFFSWLLVGTVLCHPQDLAGAGQALVEGFKEVLEEVKSGVTKGAVTAGATLKDVGEDALQGVSGGVKELITGDVPGAITTVVGKAREGIDRLGDGTKETVNILAKDGNDAIHAATGGIDEAVNKLVGDGDGGLGGLLGKLGGGGDGDGGLGGLLGILGGGGGGLGGLFG